MGIVYTIYLSFKLEPPVIINSLSEIFLVDSASISSIDSTLESNITYEIRKFNCDKVTKSNISDVIFDFELNIFVTLPTLLKCGIFNNFNFASILSAKLNKGVLIYSESEDPYLWIYVDKSNYYLVDQINFDESNCILVSNEKKGLLLRTKVEELIPNTKEYLVTKHNEAYKVESINLRALVIP